MKKILCTISNILLSVLYIPVSCYWAIFGVLLIVAMDRFHVDSVGEVVFLLSAVIMVLTPVFAILGIALSVVQRKKRTLRNLISCAASAPDNHGAFRPRFVSFHAFGGVKREILYFGGGELCSPFFASVFITKRHPRGCLFYVYKWN